MNAAIYTENLATRTEAAGLSNAHAYQSATTSAAREAFRYANEVNNGSYSELEANVTDAVEGYNNVTRRQHVTTGHAVNVTVASTTRGTNVSGGDGGDFQANANDDWTVANDVSNVREFTIDVERGDLDGASLVDVGVGTDEFRVVARGASERWVLNVSLHSAGTATIVGVKTGGSYDTCTTSSPAFTINVSAGTVDGDDCPALDVGELPDSYDLEFRNATNVDGSYSVVVDGDVDETRSPYGGSEPRTRDLLYSMTVETVYRSPDLQYNGTRRIAPGESYG
jgi:hypothetical protein